MVQRDQGRLVSDKERGLGRKSEEKGNRVKRYYKEGKVRNRPNWKKLGIQKLI